MEKEKLIHTEVVDIDDLIQVRAIPLIGIAA